MNTPWRSRDWLVQKYVVEDKSITEICDECNGARGTIHNWLKKHGIKTKSPGYAGRPKKNRVHFRTHFYGYEEARSYNSDTQKVEKVFIHRLAAVSWFGFDALEDKIVHHKSNIPWDNRESNFEIMTQGEHITLHNKGD